MEKDTLITPDILRMLRAVVQGDQIVTSQHRSEKTQVTAYLRLPDPQQLIDLCQLGDISLFSFLYCAPFMRKISYYSRHNKNRLNLCGYL